MKDLTGKFILNDKIIRRFQGKHEILVLKTTGVEILLSKENYSANEVMTKLLMIAQEYEDHIRKITP